MVRARILVIEDNYANIELIDCVLRANGYTSLLATNGDDGIRIAVLQHPDLILLDIRMPGLTATRSPQQSANSPGLNRRRSWP